MRFRHLMVWELRFMMRYSILLLDILLTSLYAALLISLPPSWKENTAALLIFSDPAAMGIFFMGAIVLLEKSQHVTAFLSVSPLRVRLHLVLLYEDVVGSSGSTESLAVEQRLALAVVVEYVVLTVHGRRALHKVPAATAGAKPDEGVGERVVTALDDDGIGVVAGERPLILVVA